ncbi:MAG: thioredoxin domain-containing protein [Coriobacteriia bacterium]|nr:thioredoxin domain-containing protein [Coriobacteriia bacterium]
MAPVVDRLKTEYESVVDFRIINVDSDPEGAELADGFGLQFVPSFIFLGRDGSQQDLLVGEVSEDQMRATLDALKQ